MSTLATVRTLLAYALALLFEWIRIVQKTVLYRLTKKHEIFRICLSDPTDIGTICENVDSCLKNSKQLKGGTPLYSDEHNLLLNERIPEALDSSGSHEDLEFANLIERLSFDNKHLMKLRIESVRNTLECVFQTKTPPPKISHQELVKFKKTLESSLYRIAFVKQMKILVKNLARVKYDSKSHRDRILNIWNSLLKDDCDAIDQDRLTSGAWSKIGFQGRDPGTDFRGMGLLSLINLEYLATTRYAIAMRILKSSLNHSRGYPFAIVGINITYLLHNLVTQGYFDNFFYKDYWKHGVASIDVVQSNPIDSINQLYISLYRRFDRFWMNSEMESIMEFSIVMTKFVTHIKQALEQRAFEMR